MKHQKSNIDIYTTDKYDIFQSLEGNRATVKGNIKKIYKAMRDYGYIGAPIVVNEKMEVIDGQNRLEAAKQANISILYMICPGYGIDECIALNRNTRNWTTTDYIHSYAEQDLKTYIWMEELKVKYPEITMDDIGGLVFHRGKVITQSSSVREAIRSGQLDLTDKEMEEVEDKLEFLKKFAVFKGKGRIGGRTFILYNAILYCYTRPEVNNTKLFNVFNKHWTKIQSSVLAEQYLDQIDTIYNRGLAKDKRIATGCWYREEKIRTSSSETDY